MAEPPKAGPSSDIDGVNRDARVNTPNKAPELGTAESLADAEQGSAGNPPASGKMAPKS